MSDTSIICTYAAKDALMQSVGYHRCLSRWLGKIEEEIEPERHDVEVVRKKLLRTRDSGNVDDMSWWWRYSNVSELSRKKVMHF